MLWKPAFFGVKPSLVLKGGFIAAAAMGDPNASIPTPQPVHYRPMFGTFGGALHAGSLTFVSQAALAGGIADALRPAQAPGRGEGLPQRDASSDMVHNAYTAEDGDRRADLRGARRRRSC